MKKPKYISFFLGLISFFSPIHLVGAAHSKSKKSNNRQAQAIIGQVSSRKAFNDLRNAFNNKNATLINQQLQSLDRSFEANALDAKKSFIEQLIMIRGQTEIATYKRLLLKYVFVFDCCHIMKNILPLCSDIKGDTAQLLINCIYSNKLQMLQACIQGGADVDTLVSDVAPICGAISASKIDILRELLNGGAKVNIPSVFGRVPLHYAVDKGDHKGMKALQVLLSRNDIDVNVPDCDGWTPLNLAVHGGHSKVVEVLLARGDIDVNVPTKYGTTPLHMAVHEGRDDIFVQLLKRGVNVNAVDCEGWTALHIAINIANAKAVELLLKNSGIDVDILSKHGVAPLHLATFKKQRHAIKLLLRHGANVNAVDSHGDTALHIAVINNSKECVGILLEHNADIDMQNRLGFTAKDIAVAYKNKNEDIINLFGGISSLAESSDGHAILNEDKKDGCSDGDSSEASSSTASAAIEMLSASVKPVLKKWTPVQLRTIWEKIQLSDSLVTLYDSPDYIACRQHDQSVNNLLIVYKNNALDKKKINRVKGNAFSHVSPKDDTFHRFGSIVDEQLQYGIYVDGATNLSCMERYGITLHDDCYGIVLPGKITSKYYWWQFALEDKDVVTPYGLNGAFVYLFNKDNTCYHRCFHKDCIDSLSNKGFSEPRRV